jgi:site-specific DNA-methyltransferase (adenine-specific)
MLENSKFKQIRLIEWIKINPIPLNNTRNYLPCVPEVALVAVKGVKPTFNSSYDKGIYYLPSVNSKNRIHPTQKNIELIKTLIEKHSNEGGVVLDTFAGSGSTAVACLKTKRNFIGCERDFCYYEKSKIWINAEKKQVKN